MRAKRYKFDSDGFSKLTHYLFRYPAKFHPPVARQLLSDYSLPGQLVLDPFCGSGTLAVEAAVLGRSTIGVDVDPVAIFVSRVKSTRHDVPKLRAQWRAIRSSLIDFSRKPSDLKKLARQDLSRRHYERVIADEGLWVPEIPNLNHWFQRYVTVDLARVLKRIQSATGNQRQRDFFLLAFASIIRSSSNADPVPVSGLEVTSHMRRKISAGRQVNVLDLYCRAVERALESIADFVLASSPRTDNTFICADAVSIEAHIMARPAAVVTSPPYQAAVDYYRRHTLEMYWLQFVHSQHDRLQLLPRYIGRSQVPIHHPLLNIPLPQVASVARWYSAMLAVSPTRARAFHQYTVAMQSVFDGIGKVVVRGTPAVFVVGKSSWNGDEIRTDRLYRSLAENTFALRECFWYPLRNRYMSYSRRNNADINRDYVLVFERL